MFSFAIQYLKLDVITQIETPYLDHKVYRVQDQKTCFTCLTIFIFGFYTEGSGSIEDVNALLAELKILSCLGSHPNILNLFGACTVKGEQGKILLE